ncbi:MAG TPA: alpha/beta hydrolase-fold protein [Polyangiaceae bacterium]|nr:alpha/beta hydrolase-fold protein [Polyangiaceae bacterium]
MPTASTARPLLTSVLLVLACSSTPQEAAPPGAAGSAGSAVAGSSGTSSAGSTSTAGGAGAATAAGAAGSGVAGTAAGSAGANTNTGAAGAAGAGTGITCAPTAEGNGTHDQPAPYGAPPEATVKAGVPTGVLTPLTPFQSTIYNHTFGYRVYVPAQYKAGQRAAFMLVEDGPSHYLGGQNTEAKFFTDKVLDNLIAEGTIPVTIALFVDPCMQKCEPERVAMYDDVTDKYARFVTEELLPGVIEDKYSIVQDPEAWLAVGFSAGAEQSFTIMWHKQGLFRKFIGHNTSFPAAKANGADYAKLVPTGPDMKLRVTLTSGTNDLSDQRGKWIESNTEMAKVFTEKGYAVRFMSGTGGHFPPDQSSMDFPNGLRWMWQGCKLSDY